MAVVLIFGLVDLRPALGSEQIVGAPNKWSTGEGAAAAEGPVLGARRKLPPGEEYRELIDNAIRRLMPSMRETRPRSEREQKNHLLQKMFTRRV